MSMTIEQARVILRVQRARDDAWKAENARDAAMDRVVSAQQAAVRREYLIYAETEKEKVAHARALADQARDALVLARLAANETKATLRRARARIRRATSTWDGPEWMMSEEVTLEARACAEARNVVTAAEDRAALEAVATPSTHAPAARRAM